MLARFLQSPHLAQKTPPCMPACCPRRRLPVRDPRRLHGWLGADALKRCWRACTSATLAVLEAAKGASGACSSRVAERTSHAVCRCGSAAGEACASSLGGARGAPARPAHIEFVAAIDCALSYAHCLRRGIGAATCCFGGISHRRACEDVWRLGDCSVSASLPVPSERLH